MIYARGATSEQREAAKRRRARVRSGRWGGGRGRRSISPQEAALSPTCAALSRIARPMSERGKKSKMSTRLN